MSGLHVINQYGDISSYLSLTVRLRRSHPHRAATSYTSLATQRTGLSVSAWRVEVLGRIGKSRPAKAKAGREHAEAVPFNDVIPF
jgi:hypothetical protein